MLLKWTNGIAQLEEHHTKKPGAIVMWVRVPGAARDFSLRVNLQCRLSYGVHTAPVCNCMTLTYVCRLKIP